MPIFIVVATFVFALLYGFIAWRSHQWIPQKAIAARRFIFGYLLLAWLTSPMPVLLHYAGITGVGSDILAWFVYGNLGFFSLLFISYLAIDVLRIPHTVVRRWIRPLSSQSAEATNPERRDFMSKAMHLGVVGMSGSVAGIGLSQAVGGAEVREVNVPLGGVPKALQDLRIVQFTDLHVGSMIKQDYVTTLVQQMNALNPDIIVMTGDLVDGSVRRLERDVAPLADLKAPLGKFFITGNHEYYSGVDDWVTQMKYLGFTVLLNEHVLIEHLGAKLLMAGVTDYRAHQYKPEHQSSPAKAIAGAPDADVKVLLAHQPKSIHEATEAGFDLQISGHTHGGQYYPWNFIAKIVNPYLEGLHHHEKKTWIYVSPGTGYWGPPVRLGTKPEITLLRFS